jgi:leucyl aminopeptidase (aminopeptidase T)
MIASGSVKRLYREVARKVLRETVHVEKGNAVTVEAWNNGLDFARHVVAEARAMGCSAVLLLEDEKAYVEGVRRAPKDMLGVMGKQEFGLLAGTDAYVFIPGQALGVYSKTLTPSERTESTRYNMGWYEAAAKAGLRGARMTFGYVGRDMAGMVGKSVDKIVLTQLKACLVDLDGLNAAAGKLAPQLRDGAAGILQSGGAELRLSFKGELSVDDGVVDSSDSESGNNVAYMPPGLVSKEVDPTSASGELRISPSLTKLGIVEEATLTFEEGVLVAWKGKGKKKLEAILKGMQPEKRRLTELNIGLNPALKYGLGRDAFVRGTVSVGGFGFTAVLRKGSLTSNGTELISNGELK